MGQPMAKRLVEAGFEVVVTNRTLSKTEPLAELGAAVVDSPRELAATAPDVVLINVTNTPDVEEILFAEQGIIHGAQRGLLVVDHSTISPVATKEFAKRLADRGIELLDAPVSGGDVGAINGTLSIMVGGPMEAFERCQPLFDVLGKSAVHLGPAGAGQACKACNQVAVCGVLLSTCEVLALAKRCDLDLDQVIEVVASGAAGSWQLANLGPKISKADYAPGFMIDLLLKDLAIIADTAEEHHLPLPVTQLVQSLFQLASDHGHGQEGTQAVATVIEEMGKFRYNE